MESYPEVVILLRALACSVIVLGIACVAKLIVGVIKGVD